MMLKLKDWLPLISSGLGATIFGFLGAYFATRGRNLATRADTELLNSQLKENTIIIKEVEKRFTAEGYLGQHELEYREKQLSELYGPIYGYLKSQRDIYNMWMEGLMQEKNSDVKSLFSSQNEIIRNLLINKTHLIDGSIMPEYFVTFFTNTIVFEMYAAICPTGEVPGHLADDDRVKYPLEFEDHIFDTTERLKSRVQALNELYAIPLPNSDLKTRRRSLKDAARLAKQ